MKLSLQKKWHIKEANPSSSKRLPLSLNSYEKMPVPDQYHSVTSQSNDLQGVCSSRPSKKKQSNPSSIKQIRPPSAEISYRNLNSLSPNPLTISSKIKSKPTIYNLMTSPKIKVKPQNNFSLTQKGFMISNYNNKISTKVKSTNDIDPQLDKAEQSSKSTQCINESNKSIQQLNETSLTIKAENPENCSKNVPFISPVNNMMRRLTLNEKERFFSTSITSSGSKPANKENNRENVNREREIYNKERENLNFKKENKESLDSEKKKISLRSFSQNPRIAQAIEVKEQSKTPIANNLIQGSPKRNENPLQKITNIVKELNDLDKDGGDYDLLRTCVLELEEKITDLKSSIELKRPPQSFKKSGNTFFMNNENKENKQSFVSVHAVPMENPLNNMVTSARPLVKPDTNENSNNNGKISIIQVQSLFNNNQNKHQYPKSTTNAELQKKKFEFQNKPKSIKIENINPQEELIPEEPQIVNNLNNVLVMHSPRMNIITNYIMNENYNKVYYISNAVNSFYKPLNTYEDSCEDNYFTQLCQEHMMQTFQSLHLSRNLFNNLENHSFENKSFEISKKESHKYKKTLIFDLDETLVHCNESLELPADVILPIMFPNGQKIEVNFIHNLS